MLKISTIIPCYNEERYIASCLDSILGSDIDFSSYEVILIDGDSSDKTVKIIQEYQKKYDFIKLLHNPKKIVPISMNLGIKEAKGDYIVRLDAHASYPKNYFSKLLEYLIKLKADNVGSVIKTEVKNKNKKSNSIKEVLSHPLGVGNSDFRTGTKEIKEVDTVPFGFYRKEVFQKYGLYNEKLIRNQDIELNKRIKKGGGKIYLIPDVTCTYYARENFKDLAKNNFANGKWNILTAYYTKTLSSLSLRHFVPLIFVFSLMVPLAISLFFKKTIMLTTISLLVYLFFVTIVALTLRSKETSFFYLVASFLTLHLSYGIGSLAGIWDVFINLIGLQKSNR